MYFDQAGADIRCEWGLEGLRQLAPGSHAIIIVDVISFSSVVDIALSRAAAVYPFPWKDDRSATFAQEKDAILAAGSRRDPQAFSLAPTSLLRLPEGSTVVLPSPNGSALSLETGSIPTFTGCLRNAAAVARAARQVGTRVSVIPAGEKWPDGSLRPGIEDLIGAGAIISALNGARSPEANVALAAFRHARDSLYEILLACSSGKEAAARGALEDVRLMAEYNVSAVTPRLVEGAYRTT